MSESTPITRGGRLLGAGLALVVIWLPLELLFLYGLHLSQEAWLAAHTALRQREMGHTLLRFRQLLNPSTALTCVWRSARAAAAGATTPEMWRQRVVSNLAVPPGAFDLFLTDGRTILPPAPGFDPGPLAGFLATCTMKAESTGSVASMFAAMVRLRQDFDYSGHERFAKFRWIALPIFPGMPNRIFDRAWEADYVYFGANTPRNSWAAFGRVPGCPGWLYLLTFHREHLPDAVLQSMALTEARRQGLPVALYRHGTSRREAAEDRASGGRGEAAGDGPEIGGLQRQGRELVLTELDEKQGILEVRSTLPLELWTIWGLAWVANLALSVAAAGVAWRWLGPPTGRPLSVGRRLGWGIMLGAGFPLLLALVIAQGMVGARFFRDLQTSLVLMEQGLRGLEEDFERYLEQVAVDYRRQIRKFPYPWDPIRGGRFLDRLAGLHQANACYLLRADGERLMTRGPYSWAAYHIFRMPPARREAFLQERIPRGAYLLQHELDMIGMTASSPVEAERAVRRILFREGRRSGRLLNPAIFSVISRMLCQAVDRRTTIRPSDIEASKSGVLLNLALQGRELEFLNDLLARLGTLSTFRMANFEGMSFVDVVRDRHGVSQLVVMLFHRVTNLADQFLRLRCRAVGGEGPYLLGAVSFDPLKEDYGPELPPTLAALMRATITEIEQPAQIIPPSFPQEPHLILARRSARLTSHVLFAALPLSHLVAGAQRLQRWFHVGLLLMMMLGGGGVVLLRRVFLAPLADLRSCVQAMGRGETAASRASIALGEMGAVAALFNQTLDQLRQMNIARTVQENLLPTTGLQAGQFALRGQSVMMSQVGGDYFDLLPAGPDRILVVVGDVAGHGLPAGIVMAMLKSGLLVLAAEPIGIDEIARQMNETLLRLLSRTKMMTAFLGLLQPSTGVLSYTNAGHNYPLLISPGRGSQYLKQINLPLGSLKNRAYKKDDLLFQPGETLIICTDGVIEATRPDGRLLGYEGFQAWFDPPPSGDPEAILAAIFERVGQWTGHGPRQDDLTVLVISRSASSSAAAAGADDGTPGPSTL
jgi:serine phosphatase RsbU (regulator of sigma subunit)